MNKNSRFNFFLYETSIHMIWGPVTVIHIYQLDKLDWHEKHRYNHQKLWNLKILIFWPKMTKCQTNLVRRKIFHRFFGLFSSQNHSIRKKKFLKIFSFFWKFWPKMTLFGPNFDPKSQIWPKTFFSWSWSPTISNEGSHAYVWKSSIFRSRNGSSGPNSREPDFSGKIRLGQLSLNIVPQLQAKNQENR